MRCLKCGNDATMLTNGKCPACGPSAQLLPPPELKKQATKEKRAKQARQPSSLESAFNALSKLAALPPYQTEYKFHPTRLWRFDVAWPDERLAVEFEGGLFQRGNSGHKSIGGIERDIAKANAATALGWRVLRFTTKDIERRPLQMMDEVKAALGLPF